MDQLANDLSFAIIDVEDIKDDFPTSLIPPDGWNIKPLGSKAKLSKPVLRSASILLRSKKLILSDSESEDGADKSLDPLCLISHQSKEIKEIHGPFGDYSRKHRVKKHKRKKESKDKRLFGQLCAGQSNFNQYFGKRKRSTTVNQQSASISTDDTHGLIEEPGSTSGNNNNNSYELNSMDCESQSECDSSSLSESVCDSDHFAEADDEQSDFYEVMSRSNKDFCTPSSSSGAASNASTKPIFRTKYSPSIPIPQNPFASVPPTPSSYNSITGGSSSILWKRRRRNH